MRRIIRISVVGLLVSFLFGAPAGAWLSAVADSFTTATPQGPTAAEVRTVVPAAGLYPGRSVGAVVEIVNGGAAPAIVTSLEPASSLVADGCPPGSATSARVSDAGGVVRDDGGGRVIAVGASARYRVVVSLDASASSGCQGVSLALALDVGLGQP